MATEPMSFSDDDFQVLLKFLDADSLELRKVASEGILGLSGGNLLEVISYEKVSALVATLLRRLGDAPEIAKCTLQTLTNFTSMDTKVVALLDQYRPERNAPSLLVFLVTSILSPTSILADPACMLLANLTREPTLATRLLEMPATPAPTAFPASTDARHSHLAQALATAPSALHQLLEIFGAVLVDHPTSYNPTAEFHYLASVLANVAQLETSPTFFAAPSPHPPALTRLLCFLGHPHPVRRAGVARVLRNLALARVHLSSDTLVAVLVRLAPPSYFALDDCLDDDVYAAATCPALEPDIAVTTLLLETLLLCTATRAARETLRVVGAYPVLRELHREAEPEHREVIEVLVDHLMRDEAPDVDEGVE